MADERDFTTLPRRALGDRRLSGMDLRVLGAISLHDGRSLAKGTGQGCWAGDRMLAKVANTDRKNVKRSTARLSEFGYLHRDTDTGNRRGFVIRVIPDRMAVPIGGEVTPYQQGASSPPIGGEVTPSIGGEVTPRIETEENIEENHIIDSPEGAHRASAPRIVQDKEFRASVSEAIRQLGSAKALCELAGVGAPYVSKARYGDRIPDHAAERLAAAAAQVAQEGPRSVSRSILSHLPRGFSDFDSKAQVPIIARSLGLVDWSQLPQCEREMIEQLLFTIYDAFPEEPFGQQARRLYENLPC